MSYGYGLTLTQTHQRSNTDSIFKGLERLLENSKYQKALEYVSSKKDQDRYRDQIDFIHSELYGGWTKRACFSYYKGTGCLFVNDPRVTAEMIAQRDIEMMGALALAYIQMKEERERSWKQFRKQWLRLVA